VLRHRHIPPTRRLAPTITPPAIAYPDGPAPTTGKPDLSVAGPLVATLGLPFVTPT
jgi:hypothetical protein